MLRSPHAVNSYTEAFTFGGSTVETDVAAFLDQRHHLIGVLHVRREHRGHELRRVVRLQIGRLVGKQRVSGRVGLVEAVAGELFHEIEDVRGELLRAPRAPRRR